MFDFSPNPDLSSTNCKVICVGPKAKPNAYIPNRSTKPILQTTNQPKTQTFDNAPKIFCTAKDESFDGH